MRQCCCTKYCRFPFKLMRGKYPMRIKCKLSHIHTCLCQHLQLSLGLATVDFGSQINMSLFPFGILFVYDLLRNLSFFCHSPLFSCTFVFSIKIQSVHCLLKERLLRLPSPGLVQPPVWPYQHPDLFLSLNFLYGLVISWRRKWHPTPVLLHGKSHGRRSLVDYSP